MRDYSKEFIDLMDNINNKAKDFGFTNGRDWAKYARENNEISFSDYEAFDKIHSLRVAIAHGHARDILISELTFRQTIHFKECISNTHLRKQRRRYKVDHDSFRSDEFKMALDWDGLNGSRFLFQFYIKKEFVQNRGFSDGTSITGYTYLIYVLNAPYINWCRKNNKVYDFHFYDINENYTPTICWNKIVHTTEEAKAILFEWAKCYKSKIIRLLQDKSIDERIIMNKVSRRGIVPADSFRVEKNKKETIYIARDVYENIMKTLGTLKPEKGGMLGWNIDDKSIDHFIFDECAYINSDTYSPDVEKMNNIINNTWADDGINFAGFIHSHPNNSKHLSQADINYGLKIIKEFDVDYIILPIVTSSYDAKKYIYPYLLYKDGSVIECSLKIYEKSIEENDSRYSNEEISKVFSDSTGIYALTEEKGGNTNNPYFDRISTVINLERMKNCAVIGVGVGGARSFYENIARLGIGNIYLIDGDVTSPTNIASQNGFISEIGINKAISVKKRILDINDECNVVAFDFMLDDLISDEWIYDQILSKYKSENIVLCASTDNFKAQKRCFSIAKKYNIPYLASGHHQYGNTSEIIYWYPNVSTYDVEYVLRDRYEAHKNDFSQSISSVGSPIFNTTRLNALCEKICLGLLTYPDEKNGKTKFSSFLKYHPNRNYILIRQTDLSLLNTDSELLFSDDDKYLFDDVVWLDCTKDF